MNLKKYKRFFAFGCSMTQYAWPTWADLIAQEIPESYNLGRCGAGNLYIACQVAEANLRYNFNNDDLVMIMWTSVAREDRYTQRNGWITPGNIYTQDVYSDKFVKKFSDNAGYFLRDMNLITLTKGLLDNLKIDYYMMSMDTFVTKEDLLLEKITEIKNHYQDTFNCILPDLLTLGLNGTWPQHPISKIGGQSADYHPSPAQHFGYLNKLFPIKWSLNTLEFLKNEQHKMEQYRDFDKMIIENPKNIL